jgi:hypothetical protein
MSSLSDIYIKKDTLQKLVEVLQKKGEEGINITVVNSDDTNQFGQNVTAYVSQSKEQREAQKPRFYVGNGKIFWTDGKITKATKKEDLPVEAKVQQNSANDLPF